MQSRFSSRGGGRGAFGSRGGGRGGYRPSRPVRSFGRRFSARPAEDTQENIKESGSEIVDMSTINSIDDIRLIVTNSKLTIQLSKLILNSSFKNEFTVLFLVLLNSIDLHSNTKINFIVSTFDLKLYTLSKSCLDTNKYTFVEILKCLKIMDSKRNIKILNEKLVQLKRNHQERLDKHEKSTELFLQQLAIKKLELGSDDHQIKQDELDALKAKKDKQDQEHKRYLEKVEKRKTRKQEKELADKEKAEKKIQNEAAKKLRDDAKKLSLKKKVTTTAATPKTKKSSAQKPNVWGAAVAPDWDQAHVGPEVEVNPDAVVAEPVEELLIKVAIDPSSTDKPSSKQTEEKREASRKRQELYQLHYENAIKAVETKLRELISYGYESTLSGNVIKIFKNWFKQIPRSTLEYFAFQPKKTWTSIASLLHLSPSDLTSDLPWFLSFMFGKPAPADTFVYAFEKELKTPDSFTLERATELINQFKPSYNLLRKSLPSHIMVASVKQLVAQYEDLDVLIWWLHELKDESSIIESIIKRVKSGESLEKVSIGTLLEKAISIDQSEPLFNVLFNQIMIKMKGLKERFVLPPPISIFGDKSGSMDVAIRLSNIISFMISTLTADSELSFFDYEDVPSPLPPNTMENLFALQSLITAGGGTDPGVSMHKLLESGRQAKLSGSGKQPKNFIVVVTDEEENGYQHGRFADLFIQYRDEINKDCKLVFISFLALHDKGQMVTELRALGVEPIQILFDRNSPDVSKIDGMLSSLSCESSLFKNQLDLLVSILNTIGEKELYSYITEKKNSLMTFSFNIELGIKNVLSLIQAYNEPTSDKKMGLLLIKNNLNLLIKISRDNENVTAVKTYTDLQQQFVKLPSDDGIKLLFNSLQN